MPSHSRSPYLSSSPGPQVNSLPTQLTLLTPSQLRLSPFLAAIRRTVNAAFDADRDARPEIRRAEEPRLAGPNTLLHQLREDPGTFTAVLHRPLVEGGTGDQKGGGGDGEVESEDDDGVEVLGTASARRFNGPVHGVSYPFMWPGSPREGFEEWELKLLAVDPGCQMQGLAGMLIRVVEEEVVRGFKERRGLARESEEGNARVRMILSTVKEVQEEYYAKRGYVWESEKERGDWYNFHIVYMAKELDVGFV